MDYGLEKRIRDTFRWKESWDNLGIEIIKRNFQSSFTFLSMVRNLFSFIRTIRISFVIRRLRFIHVNTFAAKSLCFIRCFHCRVNIRLISNENVISNE